MQQHSLWTQFALPSWAAVFLFMLWMTIRVAQSCRFLAKHLNPAKNAKKPFLNWPCLSYTNQKTCTTTAKGYTQQVIGWAACNPSCRAILLLLLACELRDTYYLYPSSDNRFIHTHTHTHTIRMQKKSRNGRDSSTALTFNYVGWNTQSQHTYVCAIYYHFRSTGRQLNWH